MTNFELGFCEKLAQLLGDTPPQAEQELPAYSAWSNYTGGSNVKTLYTNLARNAGLCSSMFNVVNGKARNVRSPKPLPIDQQPQPQEAEGNAK